MGKLRKTLEEEKKTLEEEKATAVKQNSEEPEMLSDDDLNNVAGGYYVIY